MKLQNEYNYSFWITIELNRYLYSGKGEFSTD